MNYEAVSNDNASNCRRLASSRDDSDEMAHSVSGEPLAPAGPMQGAHGEIIYVLHWYS